MEEHQPPDIGTAVEDHADVGLEIHSSQLTVTQMPCSMHQAVTNGEPSFTDQQLSHKSSAEEDGLLQDVVNASRSQLLPTLEATQRQQLSS